ncbi:MAG: hypothetical protein JSV05_03460, partial [Candidatus Bathyarchaeota archaeon]
NIPPKESKAILLLLNTSVDLPNGYFEGRVNATIEGGSVKMPYFFCILSELNCEVLSEEGSLIRAAFVLIDQEDGEIINFSPEIESARFTVPPGEYIIQALNVYGLSYSGSEMNETYSFLVHKQVSLGSDENLNVQLLLASAQKLSIKTKDNNGQALHLKLKELFTPFYRIIFLSEIGVLPSQYLYLSNISEYMTTPCYFGFMGFSQDDINWDETKTLLSDIDVYFIGWDISNFGVFPVPESLNYTNLELATFDIENAFPTPSNELSIWFNHVAGLWQSGLWYGYQTYPGIIWKAHVLPYQFKQSQSADWAQLEWSCIYSRGPYPDSTDDYFVIDRHFQPIENGERLSYSIGKTPLLPSPVHNSSSYYGDGLRIPYYPLQSEETLYLGKHDRLASKQVEVKKDGSVIYNETTLWAEDPIHITGFLETYGPGRYSFTIKTETSMDICTKNIVRYEINHTGSNDDLLPPSIRRIDATSSFTNEYPVKIEVFDNKQLEDVILSYSLDGAPWLVAPINDYGNGTYSANINLAPTNQVVSLAVEARDTDDNAVWFSTDPIARKGHSTQINGTLDGDTIMGKLIIDGGTLSQPVYLKVKTNDTIMYTLTDVHGNFQFNIPQTLIFPVELEMMNLGPYEGSVLLIDGLADDWPYDVTGDDYCGIDDIVAVAVHFGLQPIDPSWNPIYDINNDEYVDIDDIVIISEHFGTTNPS